VKRPWLEANGNTFPYRKLIHVASLKARIGWQSLRTDEFVDNGPYCVTGTDFKKGKIDWSTAYHVSKERYEMDRNIQLHEGDLLVTKDGTIGKVAVVHEMDTPATLNSGVFVVRPKTNDLSTDFLGWVIRSKVFDDFVAFNFSGSTINHLYQNVFETFRFPFPDLATQRQISDFLDRETARIDLLIEKKQRLVALLGEKAASEVDLLIGGTHPRYANAPPEYAVRTNYKLKMLCSRLGNGFVGPTRDILVEEDETDAVPYLQSTHVKNRKIDFQRKPYFVTKGWLNTKPKAQVRQDDLVIVQTGDCGATAIVDKEFHGSGCHAMIITRPKPDRILPRYLLQVLCSRSGREMLAAIQTGALHPHLEVGFVKDVSIPTPPRSVQNEILRWIENELVSLERIQEKTQTSIDRLKEYRSALITAAVTGQIDVSTYAKSGTPDRRLDAIQEEMGA